MHTQPQLTSKYIRHPNSNSSEYHTSYQQTAYNIESQTYLRLKTEHSLLPYTLHLPIVTSITTVKINRLLRKKRRENNILSSTFYKIYNLKQHLYTP
jgi:hypothetical protein